MNKFFVVATPIGNLEDMTFRAVETLKSVDVILCEDTRMTKRICERYEIETQLLSYHQRSRPSKIEKILDLLRDEKTLALVTDAGTPGISDPGNELVSRIVEEFVGKIQIVSIPGPSALTALIQVSGLNMSRFTFLGFPPNKKGRKTFFENVVRSSCPVVFFESPHRLMKNFELLKEMCEQEGKASQLVVGKEITKIYEQVIRGSVDELLVYFHENPDKIKGEFVVIVS